MEAQTVIRGSVLMLVVVGLLVAWRAGFFSGRFRDEGLAACVAAGHDPAACEAGAERHHRRCLSFALANSKSRGLPDVFLPGEYVQCILLGPEGFRQQAYEQRIAREEQEKALRGVLH